MRYRSLREGALATEEARHHHRPCRRRCVCSLEWGDGHDEGRRRRSVIFNSHRRQSATHFIQVVVAVPPREFSTSYDKAWARRAASHRTLRRSGMADGIADRGDDAAGRRGFGGGAGVVGPSTAVPASGFLNCCDE